MGYDIGSSNPFRGKRMRVIGHFQFSQSAHNATTSPPAKSPATPLHFQRDGCSIAEMRGIPFVRSFVCGFIKGDWDWETVRLLDPFSQMTCRISQLWTTATAAALTCHPSNPGCMPCPTDTSCVRCGHSSLGQPADCPISFCFGECHQRAERGRYILYPAYIFLFQRPRRIPFHFMPPWQMLQPKRACAVRVCRGQDKLGAVTLGSRVCTQG